MKFFVPVLFGLGLAAVSSAEPSGYGGPVCQTKYETIYTKQCSTSYTKNCQESSKTKYQTAYDTKCETTTSKHCSPVARKVPDQECSTTYDEVCTKETQHTTETRYDEKCQDVVRQVCQEAPKVFVKQVVRPVGTYGYGLGGYSAGGARGYARSLGKREADAEASGYGSPVCHQVKDTQCKKVPVQVPKYIEVPKCSKVPRQQCRPTERVVLDTQCVDVPKQQCAKVPKQVAIQVPFQVCEDIPQENCVDVPKQVPRKVCKEYGQASAPVRVPVAHVANAPAYGPPTAQAYAPQAHAPQAHAPQAHASQTYDSRAYAPQAQAPQAYAPNPYTG